MKKLIIIAMSFVSMAYPLLTQAEMTFDKMNDRKLLPQRALTENEFIVILSAKGTPEQLAMTKSDATTIDDCRLDEANSATETSVTCAIQFDIYSGTIAYSVQISNGVVSSAHIANIIFDSYDRQL